MSGNDRHLRSTRARAQRTTKVLDGTSVSGWYTEDLTLAQLRTLRAKERLPLVRPGNTAYGRLFDMPTLEEVLIPRTEPGGLAEPTGAIAHAHVAGLIVHGWTFRAENTFLPVDLRTGSDPTARGDLAEEVRVRRKFAKPTAGAIIADRVRSPVTPVVSTAARTSSHVHVVVGSSLSSIGNFPAVSDSRDGE